MKRKEQLKKQEKRNKRNGKECKQKNRKGEREREDKTIWKSERSRKEGGEQRASEQQRKTEQSETNLPVAKAELERTPRNVQASAVCGPACTWGNSTAVGRGPAYIRYTLWYRERSHERYLQRYGQVFMLFLCWFATLTHKKHWPLIGNYLDFQMTVSFRPKR